MDVRGKGTGPSGVHPLCICLGKEGGNGDTHALSPGVLSPLANEASERVTAERQGKRKEKTGEERAMHTFSCKGEEKEKERERDPQSEKKERRERTDGKRGGKSRWGYPPPSSGKRKGEA